MLALEHPQQTTADDTLPARRWKRRRVYPAPGTVWHKLASTRWAKETATHPDPFVSAPAHCLALILPGNVKHPITAMHKDQVFTIR